MRHIVSVSPFRCRVWDFHDRLEHLIIEDTCRAEITSFSKHGQLVVALGRPVHGDPDHDIELICGARRLFVARHLNVQILVELREMTDRAAVIAMDVENRQRLDLSPYERGLSFARSLRAGHFESQDELAKALKISQSQVSRLLTLAQLPSIVVSAFLNPLEIREGWGPDLTAALHDVRKRGAIIARARKLLSTSPRPSAVEVYQQLVSASVAGRKPRAGSCDEVVRDTDGTLLFRIRSQEKGISVLIPRDLISQETLNAIRDAVRETLKHRKRHPNAARRLRTALPGSCNVDGVEHGFVVAPST